MEAPRRVSAHGTVAMALLLVAAALAGACGRAPSLGAASSSRYSSTPSPAPLTFATPPPVPLAGAFGVLVSHLFDSRAATYSVSLVGIDGKIAARAEASNLPQNHCRGFTPPVSTSNTRAYFLDAEGAVWFLAPNGQTGRATTVSGGLNSRTTFAVSPDDTRIAVEVTDCSEDGSGMITTGVLTTRLYVEDLSGGRNRVELFRDVGPVALRPTGWRGRDNLVVAAVTTSGYFKELQVLDPATGTRKFTMGGASCPIAGQPSAAGVVCGDVSSCFFRPASILPFKVVGWTGATVRSKEYYCVGGPNPAGRANLSPNGASIALPQPIMEISGVMHIETLILETSQRISGISACGWIDDTHLFSGGDASLSSPPGVADLTTSKVASINATGTCAGRLPGAL
jgi:hypothetical protein